MFHYDGEVSVRDTGFCPLKRTWGLNMENNLLLIHGGGPTAVMNASVYGVIMEARSSGRMNKVYGAIGGTEGVLGEKFLDLNGFDTKMLEKLLRTPASAIGSSRYPLYEENYGEMITILKKHSIRYVLLNGGNGTMDTCGKLYKACREEGILVAGIPKTIDNDIACIDHSPGFGSAARFISTCVREIGEDVKSLPIHVSVVEAMGRNAGWITAASALARKKAGDAPHLIYLPERCFDEEEFLQDVSRLWEEKKGGIVVAVSEGLRNKEGESVVPPIFQTDRAVYYGDVSAHLAQLIIRRLGIKARSEKPGLLGRANVALQSSVDRQEAEWMGREAVKVLLEGKSGVMMGIARKEAATGYEPYCVTIPLEQVKLTERVLPECYINERGNDVSEEFIRWCRPLTGEDTEDYLNFKDYCK